MRALRPNKSYLNAPLDPSMAANALRALDMGAARFGASPPSQMGLPDPFQVGDVGRTGQLYALGNLLGGPDGGATAAGLSLGANYLLRR